MKLEIDIEIGIIKKCVWKYQYFLFYRSKIEIRMNWKMEIEIDWEWFDKYGIDKRNRFQYGNIYDVSVYL